jgi:glycosyltransferase involved in cell wall biosynthesis
MNGRRRIAYFGSSTAMDGGSELCLLRMAKYFSKVHEVTLFLPDEGPLFQAAREAGVEAVNLDFLRLRRYRGLDWLRWARGMAKARRRLRNELQNRRIGLVHFNDLIDLPYASAPRSLGNPSVSHLRLILGNPVAKAVYRIGVLRSGTQVVCVSEAVKENMIGDEPRIPCRVLYDPAPDPNLFFPKGAETAEERVRIRRDWGWGEDLFVLVMVSKLLPNKGHLNFLEVARRLEERAPRRYGFLMIAGPTPGRENLEQKVRAAFERLPTGRRKWIRGAANEDLPKFLRACDLLLHLPDTQDSFPGVVLEGMACGAPVVAYRVGGIPEQLGESESLIAPGELEEAVRKIQRLASDRELREETVQRNQSRISYQFSPDRFFISLENLYRDLLKGR